VRRALCRFPPTMMDPDRRICKQCGEESKTLKHFQNHILKHANIPQYRCRFCKGKPDSKFTAQKREQMYTHIRSKHEKATMNGETESRILDSCRVDPTVLWKTYGIF
jgi:hypothetical protein